MRLKKIQTAIFYGVLITNFCFPNLTFPNNCLKSLQSLKEMRQSIGLLATTVLTAGVMRTIGENRYQNIIDEFKKSSSSGPCLYIIGNASGNGRWMHFEYMLNKTSKPPENLEFKFGYPKLREKIQTNEARLFGNTKVWECCNLSKEDIQSIEKKENELNKFLHRVYHMSKEEREKDQEYLEKFRFGYNFSCASSISCIFSELQKIQFNNYLERGNAEGISKGSALELFATEIQQNVRNSQCQELKINKNFTSDKKRKYAVNGDPPFLEERNKKNYRVDLKLVQKNIISESALHESPYRYALAESLYEVIKVHGNEEGELKDGQKIRLQQWILFADKINSNYLKSQDEGIYKEVIVTKLPTSLLKEQFFPLIPNDKTEALGISDLDFIEMPIFYSTSIPRN